MSWYPRPEKDYLVAVGQANGCVTLVSMDGKKNDDLINREFSKYVYYVSNACSFVAFTSSKVQISVYFWHIDPVARLTGDEGRYGFKHYLFWVVVKEAIVIAIVDLEEVTLLIFCKKNFVAP